MCLCVNEETEAERMSVLRLLKIEKNRRRRREVKSRGNGRVHRITIQLVRAD